MKKGPNSYVKISPLFMRNPILNLSDRDSAHQSGLRVLKDIFYAALGIVSSLFTFQNCCLHPSLAPRFVSNNPSFPSRFEIHTI